MTKGMIQERRHARRRTLAKRLGIQLVQQRRSIAAHGINISEGGLCLRVEEELQVRSLVRLQFTPGNVSVASPLTCSGRVAWVIQRLDLRPMPPFLFDVGIEFVDPPATVRQLLGRHGAEAAAAKEVPPKARVLEVATVRGREFVPRLTRVTTASPPWHLIVTVDGVPCFSGHYPSERATLKAWAQFKRGQMRR